MQIHLRVRFWTADSLAHGGCQIIARGNTEQRGPASVSPANGRRFTFGLTMIVRDEAEQLPACLAAAQGLFDEIVVVDAGSRNDTRRVAESFGTKVHDFAWVNDFSAARNDALAKTVSDFAFWLNADDRLDADERDKLGKRFVGIESTNVAYVMRCLCPVAGGGDSRVVSRVRLFPNRPGVRWSYRVHELIRPALQRAGVSCEWSNVTIKHVGYNDPKAWTRKSSRDLPMLLADLEEHPGSTYVLSNLAWDALRREDSGAALAFAREAIGLSPPGAINLSVLDTLVVRAHQQLGDLEAALLACERGRALEPDDAELLYREGEIRRQLGRLDTAEACWRRILELKPPDRFVSVPLGIYGHETRRNLAGLLEQKSESLEAFKEWTAVLDERPGDAAAVSRPARTARKMVGRVLGAGASIIVLAAVTVTTALTVGHVVSNRRSSAERRGRSGTPLTPAQSPVQLGVSKDGEAKHAVLVLRNAGGAAHVFSRIDTGCPCVSVSGLPARIPAGGATSLTVSFDPKADPEFRGNLSVPLSGVDPRGVTLFRTRADVAVVDGQVAREGLPDTGAR